MSRLATPHGDDHPEAAGKHLLDAGTLLSTNRSDGAAYLSGYVVECSLKSLLQLESGNAPHIHHIPNLAQQVAVVASVAGAKTARYFGAVTAGVAASAIGSWRPEARYAAPSMSLADALAWHQIADAVFKETIGQMRLDGEL